MVISQSRKSALFLALEDYLRSKCPEVPIPENVIEIIRAEACIVQKQTTAVHWEAGKLVRMLNEIGLNPVFLKGVAYILAELEVARGRVLSDVDILVPAEAIPEVQRRLVSNGWKESELDEYDRQYFREWMHEIPPFVHIRSNTTLDVHHTILALTAKSTPNARALFDDAVETPFEGAYVLSPVDMVLHSAAHLFAEGELELGLKGLIDIERLILEFAATDPMFWDSLIPRAKMHQLETSLYYALHYCQLILKLEVPDQAFEQLGASPNRLKGWLMDFLYLRAFMPDHPLADKALTPLSRLLLYIRGHYLRMPIRILVPHLIRKSWAKRKQRKQTRQIVAKA